MNSFEKPQNPNVEVVSHQSIGGEGVNLLVGRRMFQEQKREEAKKIKKEVSNARRRIKSYEKKIEAIKKREIQPNSSLQDGIVDAASQNAAKENEIRDLEQKMYITKQKIAALEEDLDRFTSLRISKPKPKSKIKVEPEPRESAVKEESAEPEAQTSFAAQASSTLPEETEWKPTIEGAKTFDELYKAFDNAPTIPKGFSDFSGGLTNKSGSFGSEGLQWFIERIRKGEERLDSIPDYNLGIRIKVEELLAEEKKRSLKEKEEKEKEILQARGSAGAISQNAPEHVQYELNLHPEPVFPEGDIDIPSPSSSREPLPILKDSLTPEAIDLLRTVEKGGMPTSINNNFKKILADNGVAYSPDLLPIDAIKLLSDKGIAYLEQRKLKRKESDSTIDIPPSPLAQKDLLYGKPPLERALSNTPKKRGLWRSIFNFLGK